MLRSPLDQLHSSYPDLATQLKSTSTQLHTHSFDTQSIPPVTSESMTPEQVGQQRRRLASEYHSLLAQTRQLPGFESFLQPVKANELICAVRNGPVVVLNCHTGRCDALVIMPGHDQIVHLPLASFTEHKARLARSQLDASLGKKGLRQRGVKSTNQISYEEGFERMLATLWNDIVQPVLCHLGFLSRIYNYAISSYIPNLTALLASTPTQLTHSCRVLAIGQANTPGQSRLPGTTKELAHVKAHMHNKAEYLQLIDSHATTAAVLDAMAQHDWIHLACHASQNVKDPIKSGFHLHDGTLDLSAINRRSFKNKGLAFLSACQTATGDENLPDEAIHLASGMLMTGYCSVIATMWSVDDRDAPFVADKVYAQLMKDGTLGNGEAGRALHHGVARLREKVGEKKFGRWVPYIHIGS
ncbi:putative aromatic di-alanine and TPR containing protein [Rhizoctonia solani 123E]|uniref:Putative aromatic di-alanine and TPR containing protein n=1 Tax=Rhizoctonia solani 123E TaxID=1423351 RepID=A0A074RD18_9AGAM|nr:putative aromatic di-alanine and TPR containing protein [Rhizoctonia solani 123E]